MLALLLYPIFIEPNFDLDTQTWLWTVGYAVLVAMVAGCGFIVWQQAEKVTPIAAPVVAAGAGPATVTLALGPRRLLVGAGGGTATVEVRRFAAEFHPVGTVAPGGAARCW